MSSNGQPWKDRTAAEILADIAPTKSGRAYQKAWDEFEEFRSGTGEATEDDFIRYMNYLREAKKYQSSTLWSSFSRLNNCYQVIRKKKIQGFDTFPILSERKSRGWKHQGGVATAVFPPEGFSRGQTVIFSILSLQRKYGKRLQQWPRILHLLRKYEQGYV